MVGEVLERILILSHSIPSAMYKAVRLRGSGFPTSVCRDVEGLCEGVQSGAAVLVLSREIVDDRALERLEAGLKAQPSWSRIPIVLIGERRDAGTTAAEKALRRLESLAPVFALERPLSDATFLSVLRSARAFRERQYEIARLSRELADSNRIQTEVLNHVSREIRASLCAIIGFSELLGEARLSLEERQSFLRTIRRNGRKLSSLIDDVVDLTDGQDRGAVADRRLLTPETISV